MNGDAHPTIMRYAVSTENTKFDTMFWRGECNSTTSQQTAYTNKANVEDHLP